MAIYIVDDMNTISHLFHGWDETFIWSCLQGCMGIAYADSLHNPLSAQISLGDFLFFAGEMNYDLVGNKPTNLHSDFAIMVPQNQQWEEAIEHYYKEKAVRYIRYATKKEKAVFDKAKLQSIVDQLPLQYELRMVDNELYEQILSSNWARDLCLNYTDFSDYQTHGLGVVILYNGIIVSGASSYISFHNGIEIEIDTREDKRRKGLALICGAKLILECLKRGWYPSWDAHNKASLALAEKLGYHFDKEYPAYEIEF